jgi:hypothetical protein
MIPALQGENKFKPNWQDADLWREYEDCKARNLEIAQAKSFANWQAIWDELNRVDRERLGI